MKSEDSFRQFLATLRSARTGKALSRKVVGDYMSRLRRVERVLDVELKPANVASDAAYESLLERIRENGPLLGGTDSNPYGYNTCVHALRFYRDFLTSASK
jgi:hypothetical protein